MNWLHLVSYFFGGLFLAMPYRISFSGGRDATSQSWVAAPRHRSLWNRLYACCGLSWILVVRCGPRGDRSGRPHLHERDEQYDAAFDQAHHARGRCHGRRYPMMRFSPAAP